MDGGRRLSKAWLAGYETVHAVRFPVDPEADGIVPSGSGIGDAMPGGLTPDAEPET